MRALRMIGHGGHVVRAVASNDWRRRGNRNLDPHPPASDDIAQQ
jgi:hypothetical protein